MLEPCPARYRVLLLDFGGVCIPHPFEVPELLAAALHVDVEAVRWPGPFDPERDPLWRRQQAGEISERDYWAIRAAEVGRLVDGAEWTLPQFMRRFHEAVDPAALTRPEADRLVDVAIERGVPVAVLTNDLRYFAGDRFIAAHPLLNKCRLIVDASLTGVLKPDPDAYRLALEALQEIGPCRPDEVLFVDDQPANVTAGTAAAIPSLWFDIQDATASWRRVAGELFCPALADELYGPAG